MWKPLPTYRFLDASNNLGTPNWKFISQMGNCGEKQLFLPFLDLYSSRSSEKYCNFMQLLFFGCGYFPPPPALTLGSLMGAR